MVVTKKNGTCEFYNGEKNDDGIQKLINVREKVSSEESGSTAETVLQYGGKRNINPRPSYIHACCE